MSKYDLILNGHGFLLDNSDNGGLAGPLSVAVMRPQTDTGSSPGFGSLNREDAWRVTQSSWHHGAGQRVYDANDSDEFRYYESQGVDPWTKNSLSLLHAADEMFAPDGSGTGHSCDQVMSMSDVDGDWLYAIVDGVVYEWVVFTGDPETLPADGTDFFALTTSNITSMTNDGKYVYIADGSNIYRFTPTSADLAGSVGAAWNTLDADELWYVRGRLMAAKGGALYNITTSTPPTALVTHPNTGWTWTAMGEAGPCIYVSGNAGSQSAIYKITIADDGTALDEPVSAAQLPDGETVLCLTGYAGFLVVGTSMGARLATPDSNGFLTLGKLIPIGPVSALAGHDRFVWAGTRAVGTEDTSCPLWRLDLSEFTSPLTPAYARDLEGGTFDKNSYWTVETSSITSYLGRTWWAQTSNALDGFGVGFGNFVYAESDLFVPEGTVSMGQVTFGIADTKTGLSLEVRHEPLTADPMVGQCLELVMFWDFSDEDPVTGPTTEGSTVTTFDDDGALMGQLHSSARPVLTVRSEADQTLGPTLTSISFRARPTPQRATEYHWPVVIAKQYQHKGGSNEGRSVSADKQAIIDLAEEGLVRATYDGDEIHGFVEDYQYVPEKRQEHRDNWMGVMNVKFKVVA